MNKFARSVLIIALILIPTIVLYLISLRTQNDGLLLLSVVIGAVLAGLAAFKDILELVDRFTGREGFDSDSQDLRMIVRVVEPVCGRGDVGVRGCRGAGDKVKG